MRIHAGGFLQSFKGNTKMAEVQEFRGDLGIESEKDESFICPRTGNLNANYDRGCPQGNPDDKLTKLYLKSYYRLLSLYAIGLGFSCLMFALELTLYSIQNLLCIYIF